MYRSAIAFILLFTPLHGYTNSIVQRCTDVKLQQNCSKFEMLLFENTPYWEIVASYMYQECPHSRNYDDGKYYQEACPEIRSIKLDSKEFIYMKIYHEDNTRHVHYEKFIFDSEQKDSCVSKMSVKKIDWDCNVGLDLTYNPALWEEYYIMETFDWKVLGTDFKTWIILWYCKDFNDSRVSSHRFQFLVRSSLTMEQKNILRSDVLENLTSIGMDRKLLHLYDMENCEKIRKQCSNSSKQSLSLLFFFIVVQNVMQNSPIQ